MQGDVFVLDDKLRNLFALFLACQLTGVVRFLLTHRFLVLFFEANRVFGVLLGMPKLMHEADTQPDESVLDGHLDFDVHYRNPTVKSTQSANDKRRDVHRIEILIDQQDTWFQPRNHGPVREVCHPTRFDVLVAWPKHHLEA